MLFAVSQQKDFAGAFGDLIGRSAIASDTDRASPGFSSMGIFMHNHANVMVAGVVLRELNIHSYIRRAGFVLSALG